MNVVASKLAFDFMHVVMVIAPVLARVSRPNAMLGAGDGALEFHYSTWF